MGKNFKEFTVNLQDFVICKPTAVNHNYAWSNPNTKENILEPIDINKFLECFFFWGGGGKPPYR